MTMSLVAKQIKENCDCFIDRSDEELEVMADELINLISLFTCWTLEPCETLLSSLRTERLHVPCINDCLDDHYLRFRPYYQFGIDSDSISITVLRQQGVNTVREELDASEFGITDVKGYFEFIIDIESFAKRCACSCSNEEIYLEINYDAGFDELPKCLFPEVCDVLTIMTASKIGCGSVDDCCSMSKTDIGYKLQSKRIGELSWTWKQDKDSSEYLFNQLIIKNKFKALGLISLCGTSPTNYESNLWAIGSVCGR